MRWLHWLRRLALAPAWKVSVLWLGALLLTLLAATAFHQKFLYAPERLAMIPVALAPAEAPVPADFTPVAAPPPGFGEVVEVDSHAGPSRDILPLDVPPPATPTPSLDAELGARASASSLHGQGLISILLLGTDGRPGEGTLTRTDSMMLVVIEPRQQVVTLISIPRDLWVSIPGYAPGRVNTAYFLGAISGRGPEIARRTVGQLLGLPVTHSVVVDFAGFRSLVGPLGEVEIDVPEAIDDRTFPDDSYGTIRLQIDAGPQRMDATRLLQYARTRHGSSDIRRAERQQLVLDALRRHLLRPDQLPHWPSYLDVAMEHVETTLTPEDLFYLARLMRTLPPDHIRGHVLRGPLLWNGTSADGQQVLLYDPYAVQSAVQRWLWEPPP